MSEDQKRLFEQQLWNIANTLHNETKISALRFPGFKGEWEEKQLGEISKWSSGGTTSKENSLFWNGDIPWISASSMKGIEFGDSELKIS